MYKRVSPVGLRPRGFTLIELMVVIAIIGILSSIIVAGLNGAREGARDAERISDINNIALALALYYSDNGYYPCTIYTNSCGALTPFTPIYMSTVPTDPTATPAFYYYSAYPLIDDPINDSTNCNSNRPQVFNLGAVVETNAQALNDDSTWGSSGDFDQTCSVTGSNANTDFHQDSVDCGPTQLAPERCYNVPIL